MVLPRKETLVYYEEIDNWITSEEITSDGVILVFKKDTPSDVIELFEKIKDKLDFKVKEYKKRRLTIVVSLFVSVGFDKCALNFRN